MMKLNETVEMMNSANYKERFKAEYDQLAIRYYGLKNMLAKWDAESVALFAKKFKCGILRAMYIKQIHILMLIKQKTEITQNLISIRKGRQ